MWRSCITFLQLHSLVAKDVDNKQTLKNVVGAIKNGHSRETGNIQDEDKQKQKTQQNICWTSLCAKNHK